MDHSLLAIFNLIKNIAIDRCSMMCLFFQVILPIWIFRVSLVPWSRVEVVCNRTCQVTASVQTPEVGIDALLTHLLHYSTYCLNSLSTYNRKPLDNQTWLGSCYIFVSDVDCRDILGADSLH